MKPYRIFTIDFVSGQNLCFNEGVGHTGVGEGAGQSTETDLRLGF